MRAVNTCRALADLRVIDLTGALGAICGKILADLGADVLRIEPPGGHPLRRRAPLADGVPDGEAGLGWWAYAAGCDNGILDLTRDGDGARLLDLAARADVVLESFAPGHLASLGLGWDALHRANPGLVLTSITPFGQTGPRAGFRGPELVLPTREPHALMAELQAAGVPAGAVQSCADLQRDPGLIEREALPLVDHPEMGRTPHEAWAFRTMGRPQSIRRAPCLGEHTHEVLRDLLELADEEIRRLDAAGILA